MIENVELGQRVWLKTEFVDVNSGSIVEIHKEEGIIEVKLDTLGTVYARTEYCYPIKESLLLSLQQGEEAKIKDYCNSIQTVQDLVRFCYRHNFFAEEYSEPEAKKAAEIRARSLLGTSLGIE